MYARVTSVKIDPAKLDQGVANFKEKVVPMARTAPGYAGVALLLNRETGEGGGVTYWNTLADMNAAEQVGQQARRQSSEATGAEVLDVDRFEIVLVNRVADPVAPLYSRVNQLYADPSRIEEAIAFVRDTAIPNLSTQKGYRSILMGVNRMTGRCFVTSNWETSEDRAASEPAAVGQRRQAATIAGAKDVEVTLFEVAFIEVKQPIVAR
jgi:heme-degrading monooxygenase HmoA